MNIVTEGEGEELLRVTALQVNDGMQEKMERVRAQIYVMCSVCRFYKSLRD